MTSTRNPLQDFILTPQQQTLLFAALNSNRPPSLSPTNNAATLSPSSLDGSPLQNTDANGMQESPFLDYDYSFDGPDSSFDFSFDNGAKMIGDLPGTSAQAESASPENDSSDKRSHPDEDDDEEESPNGAKRRESTEKVPKKPGRKPLTSEPSSKRKAQNRAAQRAFRERKEKHLKDLETKVQELEKASEAANHENDKLRAQVDKMTVELGEYKKRLSLVSAARPPMTSRQTFGTPIISNINDVNFQFEFPKFGQLPGPSAPSNGITSTLTKSPVRESSVNGFGVSRDQSKDNTASPANSSYSAGLDTQTKDDLANFSGIFNPPLTNNNIATASRGSLDSHFSMGGTSTSSPSASSNSNVGPSSSCGTSPEPFTQSPMGFKPVDTLTTIGEEQPTLNSGSQDFGHFANIDVNDFSWLASQSNFQFEPELFGNYREPQDSVLANGLDDSFFNDALDTDFAVPYNMAPSPVAPKKDLIAAIDAAKEADSNDAPALLTCNKIWEKLQNCPKVQAGDFDLDGLCSDLQKKAKCSGSGAVVDEKDFKSVMQKYLGKDGKQCTEGLSSTTTTTTTTATITTNQA